ncbi:condensation domain-containing protein [Streptomyces sp. CBMA123]|uniref:condensation domain-containing protein n=1 Tax=Streptomyces sp. CBMA123 TaxID=1896313 RepID=UPI001661CA85|nr:condensation domain-containing protein [Streptomyces sp. CBMA123]MBD0689732.1 hypothetical protein [Streptomyces sp. CBMA123]
MEKLSLVERSGPLTTLQTRWWLRIYWREQGAFDIAWSKLWELPPGISVDTATEALTVLVERHESLRTAIALGPDNLPVQLVYGMEGLRLPVSVADLDTLDEFGDLAGVHPLVGGSILMRPPWSARLFVEDGEVRALALIFEHVIIDGSGTQNLREQFLALCRGTEEPRLRITHPLDRVAADKVHSHAPEREDHSPDPRGLVPQLLVPAAERETDGPRFVISSTRYAGLLPIIDRICRRHRVSRAMVLMHALGWLFSRHSGIPRIMFGNAAGHRLPTDDSIDDLARTVEVVLDFAEDRTFAESLADASATLLRVYAEDLRLGMRSLDSRARLAERRGVATVRGLYFNFQGPSQPGESAPDGEHGGAPVEVTRTDEWRPDDSHWTTALWVYVDDTTVSVDFDIDTVMFPAPLIHTMGELLPRFIRLIDEQPDEPLLGARAILPEGYRLATDSLLVQGAWVDLGAVARVVGAVPGVLDAAVTVEADEIVAQLALDESACLFDVHEHVRSLLHDSVDLVAPHRYRLTDASKTRATGRGLADLAEGADWVPGHALPVLGAETEPERELLAALRETQGLEPATLALTYTAAGGRAILAPSVVESLRRRGLTGLRRWHFDSPCTLRTLARALVRESAGHPL